MNTRIIIKALLDEKDCKLHGHCIVYVGDQCIIKFHANIIEIFKMQFGVFLVRGFQMRFSPSRFYYEVNVIERSARQNPFEYKLQTSIGGLSTSPSRLQGGSYVHNHDSQKDQRAGSRTYTRGYQTN
jgi:hypothetical protein